MKQKELLSPVGNKEMLYQAIHNGADAVYLSGNLYGARKFAKNFNNEELKEAVEYARLYGVKVYVTVNTLIYEEEINDVLDYLDYLHQIGVNAVIMQDIGLIYLTRQIYPNLEIHASTQCHNHNNEILKLWKSLGLSRAVLARELSIEEIENINVDIEKEVFIYGALCVCYSGCCLFSSLNGGRSGNRGECVGSCRLPYKLIKNNEIIKTDGNYLLSTKELNTLDHIKELLDSNITSFKIEGRMKSPSYVGYVTRLYRTLIDKYNHNKDLNLTSNEINNLKKLFNREFTNGYLFSKEDIMNIKTPNHQGIEIGKVVAISNHKIKIKLVNDSIHQNDGIRFKNKDMGMIVNRLYNKDHLLVNEVSIGNICYLDNRLNIKIGDTVLKTIDSKLNQELNCIIEKKIPITVKVNCQHNKRIELTIKDNNNNQITVYGDKIEVSIKREVTKEDIIKQLSKVGNTPYRIEDIEITKDNNIFISLKNLNEIRRDAIDKLTTLRKENKIPYLKNTYKEPSLTKEINNNIYLNILVRTEEQLKVCLNYPINTIYVTDYNLYLKYKDYPQIYYRLDRVMNNYKTYKNEKLLVGELGSVYKYHQDNTIITDYYLNITNHYSINLLKNYNVKRITLSVELNDNQIKNILKYTNQVELIVYGRLELMVMKYCPLKKCLNYCKNCKNNQDKFYLEDKFNHNYPIINNQCLTHIMHYQVENKLDKLSTYQDMGISYYRLELFNEDKYELEYLINQFLNT